MKKSSLLLLLLSVTFWLTAGSRTIINPSYEVKNSGIYNVSKIELSDTETRVSIHSIFLPNWWVQFDGDELLKDLKTGKTYTVTGIEGAEFKKRLWMPKSGDSTIVLIFPPLDKSVKKIDYCTSIFGISLDEKQSNPKKSTEVPKDVTKWLNTELAKSTRKTPIDFNSDQFFSAGKARLVGYLKGYDVRLGFTTGIIYASNDLTGDDYPIVVQIHPDGRFEADVPMITPKYTYISVYRFIIPAYLEPGQTLSMILDWDEFLLADRLRNIRYQIKDIAFQGPLAKVNYDLTGYKTNDFDYKKFQKNMETLAPEEFKTDLDKQNKEETKHLEEYIGNHKLTSQATAILRNKQALDHGGKLFDYVMRRSYQATKDTANQSLKIPVPENYYDFLKNMDLNDKSLLIPNEFKSFVNRFEFCEPFRKSQKRSSPSIKPQIDFATYLLEESKSLTKDENELCIFLSKKEKTPEEKALLDTKKNQIQELTTKYKDQIQMYWEKYFAPLYKAQMTDREQEAWKAKDSLLTADLGLNPNLVYEITKIRSLKYTFSQQTVNAATSYWNDLKQGVTNPYLIKTGEELLAKTFPEEKALAYTLPEGPATEIFRKIVDPFKGKILFIDFWATTCGPCVSGIKRMKPTRAINYGDKDFDFIFITDERSSPEDDYKKFIAEQDLVNTYRISPDDYNYLRQLFKFNGIPRYVVIDKDGKVLNDNFPMHNFDHELKNILSK